MNVNETFRYLNIGLPESILRHKLHGDLAGAIRLIDLRLARANLPEELRGCLLAEREMMRRMPADYPFSKEDALAVVRVHIPDFSEEEFDRMVDEEKIGWIYLDGEMRFFDRFFDSLCKTDAAFAKRAGIGGHGVESAQKGSPGDLRLTRVVQVMREKGQMSHRICIRAAVQLKEEAFKPGMFLRVHLPIPAACEQQSDIVIEKMYPENGMVAPEDALQRTVCWEETMTKNHEFSVEYSYTHTAKYHDVSAMTPSAEQPDFCLEEEAPHIVFTPYLKALTAKLCEGCTTPLEKARKFFDFVTLNCKYTFMPAYFSLENIPENCARNFTGDCGVFALLFLTLCRCAGIPAQWQSGLTAEPDFLGGHDWVRFYVAPYGWLYADPSYGTAAVRAGNEERRKFYFGNLDPYRMVANNGFQKPFTVEKQQWRADPYDNQLGEMETTDHGFGYQEYTRTKEIVSHQEL